MLRPAEPYLRQGPRPGTQLTAPAVRLLIAVPHQKGVHLVGGGAPFLDGPDHQGLAPAHVSGGEHLGHIGGVSAGGGADSGAGGALQSKGLGDIGLGAQEAGGDEQ